MKALKQLNKVAFLAFALVVVSGMGIAPFAAAAELVVADFDTGDKPNNLGGDFGTWDKDPADETQTAELSFEADDALGDDLGYSIKLNYDVDSPNPAYNGFWMGLDGLDVSSYSSLNFYIRGEGNFTERVKIELKDGSGRPSPFIVSGITDNWQMISIPFEKFRRIKDWSSISEFIIVFDDINSNPKSGAILVDQVAFAS